MIKIVEQKEEANAITHAGSFHADDVFSTIFLSKLFGNISVYRAKEWNEIPEKDVIVYDIGYQEFDHHGETARVRENGIKYSAFGLLFEKYGKEYLKKKGVEDIEEAYQMFLREFVMQIDAIDNGIFPSNPKDYHITTLSEVIELFNKTWLEQKNENEAFLEAIEIGTYIYNRIEKRIFDKLKAKKKVEEAVTKSQEHIVYLEEYMPFMEFLLSSKNEKAKEIYFAIFPSNRGGYNIRAINKELGNNKNRFDFPKEWGGKSQEELQKQTQIKTFRFCHINRFLSSTDTLEDAYKVAKQAIQKEYKK